MSDDFVPYTTYEDHPPGSGYRIMPTPYDAVPTSDHGPVNHPKHYTSHPSGVECIQITEHLSFCVGNAIKYLWRADLKNGTEDLEKAAWYVAREIDRRKRGAHS